eukprot:CAMPEP_0182486858 /NCGR_PEP_ID=MMETSP1319-20130603/47610_1 /TAXON_ID=172717 /ORGANISM="Bolidomonas pacifica, Strain RCC208" /LENGTH=132 /DNA_ID=CAMNT_0024688965 /DNA_START=653 /DNA_END=1048 /DNA_ORIENTATION=+
MSILPTDVSSPPYAPLSPYAPYPKGPPTFLSLSPLSDASALRDFAVGHLSPSQVKVWTRPSSKVLVLEVPRPLRSPEVQAVVTSLEDVDRTFTRGGGGGKIKIKYLSPSPTSPPPSWRCTNYRQPPRFQPSL